MTARPLAGRLAVITGASGGLGAACARALATAGAGVALLARTAEPLHALASAIEADGGRALALPCDVTDAAAVRHAFAGLDAPDVLVTCAGGNRPGPFLEVGEEELDWSWRLNVRGAFLCSQAAARRMVAAGRGGSVVHVSSQMGHVGAELRTAYCTAKHAVEGLTRSSAVELAPHGIRVNSVAPTFVETPMTRPFLAEPAARAAIVERIPLGRLGTPEEVAAAVLFAASPASALMTGASLVVDGGLDGAVTVRLATGPVSWGVDFAGAPGNPPYRTVLDGAVAAGFRWLELGPLGYLPAGAGPELAERGLGITAGFVFEPLHDAARLGDVLAAAEATAARVAEAGGRFLVVIDAVSPERAATAGRPAAAPRLRGRARAALLRAVDAVAGAARARGLRPVVHPHAGTHVEFADEIEPLAEVAELCLDTGHLAYAGLDPVAAYRQWAGRVPYLHLKDFDPARRAGDFWASVAAGAFRPLGEGVVDLPALGAALAEHGYDGWATIEQDRDAAAPGDPVADLIASRRHAERCLGAA